ncbi:MAG: glycosyltransferase [Halobacteriales archaeon]
MEAEAGDRVAFLGQVPYEEMPAVYRAGDVLVLPSRAEGVPRTVIEGSFDWAETVEQTTGVLEEL